jgi:hypothetical protein
MVLTMCSVMAHSPRMQIIQNSTSEAPIITLISATARRSKFINSRIKPLLAEKKNVR